MNKFLFLGIGLVIGAAAVYLVTQSSLKELEKLRQHEAKQQAFFQKQLEEREQLEATRPGEERLGHEIFTATRKSETDESYQKWKAKQENNGK